MITQLFQPEPNHLKGLAFARELVRLGHDVEVLTGFPNYPGGKIYPGYRQRWYQRETIDGVSIIRVPVYPDHSSSGFRRALCYASLALTACIPGLFLVRRPDVVHVYQGPATLALPAMILSLLRGVPYVLDIQDLWPESVMSSDMLTVKWLKLPLTMWCNLTYKLSAMIVVLSPGYEEILVSRGCSRSKVKVVYNWCDEGQLHNGDSGEQRRDTFGLTGRFSVVYAGNMGRVQALDAVLDAADLLKKDYQDIMFVFVGDGVDASRLENIASSRGLNNVRFIPRQPASEIGAVLDNACALLIHLRDDPQHRGIIPQKTQAYLAAGRPIIMGVKGDAADLVEEAGAGIACEPQNPLSIAEALKELHDMLPEKREEMGRNGLIYYEKHLSFRVGLDKMISIFAGTACRART